MANLKTEIAIVKTWATAHLVLAAGIAFAIGVIVGAAVL
jgi:hypothetical protein